MDNVIRFGGITKLPIAPDDILDGCKGMYSRVIIIGVDEAGNQHLHASESDMIVCNFDIDRAKAWVMRECLEAK